MVTMIMPEVTHVAAVAVRPRLFANAALGQARHVLHTTGAQPMTTFLAIVLEAAAKLTSVLASGGRLVE